MNCRCFLSTDAFSTLYNIDVIFLRSDRPTIHHPVILQHAADSMRWKSGYSLPNQTPNKSHEVIFVGWPSIFQLSERAKLEVDTNGHIHADLNRSSLHHWYHWNISGQLRLDNITSRNCTVCTVGSPRLSTLSHSYRLQRPWSERNHGTASDHAWRRGGDSAMGGVV